MPENEFEKKIANEMQELKFTPSASVWPQVEERIRKKKNRRILIFIFLLAGLGLLGWWQWDNFFGEKENDIAKTETVQKNNTIDNKEEAKKESSVPVNSEKAKTESGIAKINEEDDEKPEASVKNKITQQAAPDKATIKSPIAPSPKPADIAKNKPAKKSNILEAAKNNESLIKEINNKPAGIEKDTVSQKAQVDAIQKINEQKQELEEAMQLPEQKADSSKAQPATEEKNEVEKKDSVLETLPVQDSLIAEMAKKKSVDKKWKWGAQFTPGISFLNENGFSIGGLKSVTADFQSNPGGGGTAAPQRQLPSAIKPGFAFQIGGFLQRDISKRSNISLGLQYGFYSHKLGIGRNRDSLLNTLNQFFSLRDVNAVYNAGGDTITYQNRYHFLELPFRFQWQINNNSTQPMYWSFGFTVGQLIGTNTIQYDTAFNGIYYQNKKIINKTQFSLSTGFSFTISNNQKTQWSLGPFVQFHLNKLVDNPFENKKYLFFTGLRTSVIFKRK
jgi:hypothetical protein